MRNESWLVALSGKGWKEVKKQSVKLTGRGRWPTCVVVVVVVKLRIRDEWTTQFLLRRPREGRRASSNLTAFSFYHKRVRAHLIIHHLTGSTTRMIPWEKSIITPHIYSSVPQTHAAFLRRIFWIVNNANNNEKQSASAQKMFVCASVRTITETCVYCARRVSAIIVETKSSGAKKFAHCLVNFAAKTRRFSRPPSRASAPGR